MSASRSLVGFLLGVAGGYTAAAVGKRGLQIGRRLLRRKQGQSAGGYWYLHHAVDDYSWLVYFGILNEEKKYTAAGFGKWGHRFSPVSVS